MKRIYFPLAVACIGSALTLAAWADSPPSRPPLRVVVNSNQDGPVQANDALTLREAIEIVNGTLAVEQLSAAEKTQVQPLESGVNSNGNSSGNSGEVGGRIEFSLPPDQTTIQLTEVLPELDQPGLVVDGTTQPGYDATKSATAEIAIPIPVVALTPAAEAEVFRGLSVVADNITIRGLSLYGFTSRHRDTESTPPADIFIAHRLPPPNTSQQQPPNDDAPFYERDRPPQNVLIENNWLGIRPDGSMPEKTSAFGVSVFNSSGTQIRRNRIADHEGSAIITSVRADNLRVSENIIVGNGIAGMPDAIRLEGVVDGSQLTGNLICGNDGSGVFLFKPQGSVQIRENRITFNGRRLRRAAVYLMGNDHQVVNNQISDQVGPGVVVAAYPQSERNLIQANRFSALEGLSIDLVAQFNTEVQAYQRGDGPNPRRNSPNRRKDTGNAAINAPQFLAREFLKIGSAPLQVQGTADPGSQVELYRVLESANSYAPLSEPLATALADAQGRFSATLPLQAGDRFSAVATDPRYGTSEPAPYSSVGAIGGAIGTAGSAEANVNVAPAQPSQSRPVLPQCTTPPAPPTATPPELPPAPVELRVPRNVHFALDQATISPVTAQVLDRIAAVLRDNPTILVELQGHTDPRASYAYNLDLSNRRALAVRNYLLRQGITPERMTIRALGESQLLNRGTNRVDYARNRRVEFLFRDFRGIEPIVQEEDLQIEPAGSR